MCHGLLKTLYPLETAANGRIEATLSLTSCDIPWSGPRSGSCFLTGSCSCGRRDFVCSETKSGKILAFRCFLPYPLLQRLLDPAPAADWRQQKSARAARVRWSNQLCFEVWSLKPCMSTAVTVADAATLIVAGLGLKALLAQENWCSQPVAHCTAWPRGTVGFECRSCRRNHPKPFSPTWYFSRAGWDSP